MSSRVLRKLRGEENFEEPAANSETELDVTVGGGAKRKDFNVNPYDLLIQQSHSESEVKEDDNETETTLAAEGTQDENVFVKRKKKKKKKKATKPVFTNNRKSSDDNIEVLVEELMPGENTDIVSVTNKDGKSEQIRPLLEVRRKNLNPNNELKRIFGSRIIQNETSRRRGHGRTYIKQPLLIKPRENWLPITKTGISMRVVSSPTFTYEHNANYRQVQKKFLEAVDSLNPDNIVSIINDHPYHVDALIQLSDLCKLSEDLQMAAELNERALYCLESAFHPTFNIITGNCHLDYRRQENRALFITIFKHLMFVGQRACYRTALELCKVLLSLNFADDPLAVVLCIDFYALRSQKYAWLVAAAEEWEATRNVSQLPNFAYSHALALYHLAETNQCEPDASDIQIQKALIMFPGVLMPLLEKCSVQPDPRVIRHNFFTSQAENSQTQPLQQLVQLYVSRTYHEWKDPKVIAWLEKNVNIVLDRVDSKDAFVLDSGENRKKRYMKTPRNVLRHIVLSDLKDVSGALPSDVQGPVLSFDPFPPLDSIDIYTRPQRLRSAYERSNAFSMFFRSLMPNFNLNQPAAAAVVAERVENEAAEADADAGAGGAAAAGVELRISVTTLLDAMRDLLSNIYTSDVVHGDHYLDNNEEEEDDDDDGEDEDYYDDDTDND
ncbi:transcription factor 25 isoform X1 [Schistocerca gregaria]|uniref:transcription factor 25 isoform X1 n=1 Tax=Schistocerca gregaria TaxID=7010 RepID=UPI00211E9F26|nr:transcription factor 25 isoform X1 [Schistocerca gregaria]